MARPASDTSGSDAAHTSQHVQPATGSAQHAVSRGRPAQASPVAAAGVHAPPPVPPPPPTPVIFKWSSVLTGKRELAAPTNTAAPNGRGPLSAAASVPSQAPAATAANRDEWEQSGRKRLPRQRDPSPHRAPGARDRQVRARAEGSRAPRQPARASNQASRAAAASGKSKKGKKARHGALLSELLQGLLPRQKAPRRKHNDNSQQGVAVEPDPATSSSWADVVLHRDPHAPALGAEPAKAALPAKPRRAHMESASRAGGSHEANGLGVGAGSGSGAGAGAGAGVHTPGNRGSPVAGSQSGVQELSKADLAIKRLKELRREQRKAAAGAPPVRTVFAKSQRCVLWHSMWATCSQSKPRRQKKKRLSTLQKRILEERIERWYVVGKVSVLRARFSQALSSRVEENGELPPSVVSELQQVVQGDGSGSDSGGEEEAAGVTASAAGASEQAVPTITHSTPRQLVTKHVPKIVNKKARRFYVEQVCVL